MKKPRRKLTVLLIVGGLVPAFLAGTLTATGSAPATAEAMTLSQLAALQACNGLLLEQGPVGTYLRLMLRNH